MRPNVERVIRRYCRRWSEDAHHRYRSWSHCYRHFRRRAWLRSQHDLRHSALQLGFYLASWGMYRGSGFLLHKDFQVHTRVVQELRRSRYDWLRGYRPVSVAISAEAIREILALVEVIRGAYDGHYRTMSGRRRTIYVSDTLATKVMLGTIGCVPAFDALVREGMRLEGLPYSGLNQRTMGALFAWYLSHEREFRSIEHRLDESGVRYPPMKLVDMYLWERGKRSLGNPSGQA